MVSTSSPANSDSELEFFRFDVVSCVGASLTVGQGTIVDILDTYKNCCGGKSPDEQLQQFGFATLEQFLESDCMAPYVRVDYTQSNVKIFRLKPNPETDHERKKVEKHREKVDRASKHFRGPYFE
ncbi:hypothetical protein L596_023676 [Steinernema carpocapsae]|uniref:DUF7515 domain-containing protein n=1 Tax=Steinernema carpocapsae TaxID=34508 RepID=A0A4U5MED1_STECR|nr:hypothetical protein L596_023676 [Steinernema carpocapsae]